MQNANRRKALSCLLRAVHIAYPLLFIAVAIMPAWFLLHSTSPTGATVAFLIFGECVLQVGLLMLHDRVT